VFDKANLECVIDIGACVGVFLDDCLERYDIGRVFAFEPLASNFAYLSDKYQSDDRVTVLPQAVSNFSGRAQLYKKRYINRLLGIPVGWRYDFAGNAGSSLKEKSNVSLDNSAAVDVISLSDFIRSQSLEHIDILKIDSEGSEYDILHDLLDNDLIEKIDKVFFEDHVRKVPSIKSARNSFTERVRVLGIEDKFYLQDVETGDDLAYVPMTQALRRDFFKIV